MYNHTSLSLAFFCLCTLLTTGLFFNPACAGQGYSTSPVNSLALQKIADRSEALNGPENKGELSPSSARKNSEGRTNGLHASKKDEEAFAVGYVAEITTDELGRKISFPFAIFLDPVTGESYILTGGKGRIVILGQDFFPLTSFGRGRGLDDVQGGTFSPDGFIVLTQAKGNKGRSRLTFLNRALFPEREINLSSFEGAGAFIPSQVTFNPLNSTYYICGANGAGVMRLDEKGDFLGWLTVSDPFYNWVQREGQKPGENVPIVDAVTDEDGYLYLLSEETGKVYVFDRKENPVHSFGTKGGSTGKLSRPRSLSIDERRRCIYVVDYMRHTILIYDLNGNFVHEFGGKGWGFGWFNYPTHVSVMPDGKILVADFYNNRVQAMDIAIPIHMPEKDPLSW